MENNRHWISNDWIKLLGAVVILFLIIFSWFLPHTTASSLPPYPRAEAAWSYDAENLALLDAQGLPVYSLSDDKQRWQPIIPAAIEAELAEGHQLLQKVNGDWIILAADGSLQAQMTQNDSQWLLFPATEQPTATPLPSSTPTRVATLTSQTPTPILMSLPTSEVGYGCQTSVPSRLFVGDKVIALSNLYLRQVPYVADNVITYNIVGAELTIVDGPRCMPHEDGYYIWWLVESPYGQVGWSEETTLHSGEYLMEPIP
jgi:hypothetical protein